jgi:CBS-domain-containing membrane protein
MNVQQIMCTDVKCCGPSDSLERAAQIMWEGDCGCVPVLGDGRRVVGMVTDRDVCMAAYTQGRRLAELPVEVAMSRTVWSIRPDASIDQAERVLAEKQVHRLPVTDGAGTLLGILSLNDIAREAARERGDRRKVVSDAEIGETVASICAPRAGKERVSTVPARPLAAV